MKLKFWAITDADDPVSPATRMFTTRRYPVYYLSIAKCGCTFLKNLFYALDHGVQHPAGNAVHAHEADLCRATPSDEQAIRSSDFAFSVLRDPVDRFLSFYFDKIYADGPHNFPALRERLAERHGLDLSPDLTVERHRKNARHLLDWVDQTLRARRKSAGHHHWKRQSTRLRRAEGLGLARLTLDGLDQQLPVLLSPLIPDIAETMGGISARNATPRPVPQAAVADTDLKHAINRVYARDRSNYDTAAENWANRLASETLVEHHARPGKDTIRVLTTKRYAVHYLAIPKVGCTFLRNLFYLLDHGKPHPDPLSIQPRTDLVRSDMTANELADAGPAFFVLRDPVARFFSLYFDKVHGTGPQAFPWIARALARRGVFHSGAEISLDQHRHNCRRLLGYIEHQFSTLGKKHVNPHWRPQAVSARQASDFGMVPLLLEHVGPQLLVLAGSIIPDLAGLIERVPTRNASLRPVAAADIVTLRMKARIETLYHDDKAIYEEARGVWVRTGRPPEA